MNNLYPASQSSYRKNYSTETALLLRVKNDILLNMNNHQHVTILVVRHLILWITTCYSVGFTQNLVYQERHLNGFFPTLMEDLSVLWSKEISLQCTAGLLPRAIAFHDLCKQIVWCYQGAPSHGSLVCGQHTVVCVSQSKHKHRAIWGCHCFSALYGWW